MCRSEVRTGALGVLAALAIVSVSVPGAARAAPRSGDCGDEHDRGTMLDRERVASYDGPDDVQAYYTEWIAFYQDYYAFPADLPVAFEVGFDSYRVTYCTVDAATSDGAAPVTAATGMVSVPHHSRPLPTVAYLHGTSVSVYDAVSNPAIASPEHPDGESFDGPPSNAVFAGAGFVYVAPDYLGLGGSELPRHRYFHAATEASATVDLLAAAEQLLDDLAVERDGRLFTFGFSQGGHAALAAHRALEGDGVEVTATATAGGIFDVEAWFLASLANSTTETLPLYVAYLLAAYDDVYGVAADAFDPAQADAVDDLFDMQHYFDDVLAGLPFPAASMLEPAFLDAVTSDAEHPLRVRLRENAVDGWSPQAPLRVYVSPQDEEVPYTNALASVERLRDAGADITVEELPGLDHVNTWVQAMPLAASWFRSLDASAMRSRQLSVQGSAFGPNRSHFAGAGP